MGGYWWRWQVPVCALTVAVPAVVCVVLIVKKLRAGDLVSHGGLWVPCWKSLNPSWLMVYRALAFFSMAWMLYQMVAVDGLFAFYFYTQWTFALVMVYFAIGTIISAQGWWFYSGKGQPGEGADEDDFLSTEEAARLASDASHKSKLTTNLQKYKQAGLLGRLLHTIYQICAGAVILTDIVFWCVLVPMRPGKNFKVTLLIGLVHSLNAVFLIIDSALNSLPCQWFGFTYCVLERGLHHLPMGSSRFRSHLVAVPFPRARDSLGTIMVFRVSSVSYSMLWHLHDSYQDQTISLPKIVPPSIRFTVVAKTVLIDRAHT